MNKRVLVVDAKQKTGKTGQKNRAKSVGSRSFWQYSAEAGHSVTHQEHIW